MKKKRAPYLCSACQQALSWDRVDALRADAVVVGDNVPADAFSLYDYTGKYGMPNSTAQHQLEMLIKAGALKTGRVHLSGRKGLIRVYWP